MDVLLVARRRARFLISPGSVTIMLLVTVVAALSFTTHTKAALAWKPCYETFKCSNLRVPLDYRHPGDDHISIAVIREPAADPAHRIGTLIVDPGGPGGSGVDL